MRRSATSTGSAGICPPAHAIIPRAETPADDHRQLGHPGIGDGVNHLRAIFGDAALLIFLAHHKAGDILQKQQRNIPGGAQFDKVRPLERALAEQHAIVGDDPHRIAFDARKSGNQRRAVICLELAKRLPSTSRAITSRTS